MLAPLPKKWAVTITLRKDVTRTFYVKSTREKWAIELIKLRHQPTIIWAEELPADFEPKDGWNATW